MTPSMSRSSQLRSDQLVVEKRSDEPRRDRVHVMIVNFSHEEMEHPKASVLGVAEETSESLVAVINDSEPLNSKRGRETSRGESKATTDPSFRQYLNGKLEHLTVEERSVMEPLMKYKHVFHQEGSNDFKGTDLVEHRIVTGDANPIRKAPYRVPFALRQEMQNQVNDMLAKGVIEESFSPWNSPALLVPKKSLDGRPKYRFCVDFRALNAVMQFDTYPLPVLEEAVATLHGSKYFTVIDCYSDKVSQGRQDENCFLNPFRPLSVSQIAVRTFK